MTRHDYEIFELGDLVLQRGAIMVRTWQHGDAGATPGFDGDLDRALGSITARAVVMPAEKDLYFPPEDEKCEVSWLPNTGLRVIPGVGTFPQQRAQSPGHRLHRPRP
jgi:homoserine O-acetyltransferase